MAYLKLSFAPFPHQPPEDQTHNLGNIADDVWKEKLLLERGMIADGRYIGTMQILVGRKLRKKERDELEDRLKALRRKNPQLDPKAIYID